MVVGLQYKMTPILVYLLGMGPFRFIFICPELEHIKIPKNQMRR